MGRVLDLVVSGARGRPFLGMQVTVEPRRPVPRGRPSSWGRRPGGAEAHGLCQDLSPPPVAPADGLPLADDSL